MLVEWPEALRIFGGLGQAHDGESPWFEMILMRWKLANVEWEAIYLRGIFCVFKNVPHELSGWGIYIGQWVKFLDFLGIATAYLVMVVTVESLFPRETWLFPWSISDQDMWLPMFLYIIRVRNVASEVTSLVGGMTSLLLVGPSKIYDYNFNIFFLHDTTSMYLLSDFIFNMIQI